MGLSVHQTTPIPTSPRWKSSALLPHVLPLLSGSPSQVAKPRNLLPHSHSSFQLLPLTLFITLCLVSSPDSHSPLTIQLHITFSKLTFQNPHGEESSPNALGITSSQYLLSDCTEASVCDSPPDSCPHSTAPDSKFLMGTGCLLSFVPLMPSTMPGI